MTAPTQDQPIMINAERALELLSEADAEYRVGESYLDRVKQFIPLETDDAIWTTNDDGNPTPRCYYVIRDQDGQRQVGCLIGAALVKAGVPLDFLESEHNARTVRAIFNCRDWAHRVELTKDAMEVFEAAQMCQDGGGTWEESLTRAKARLEGQLARAS